MKIFKFKINIYVLICTTPQILLRQKYNDKSARQKIRVQIRLPWFDGRVPGASTGPGYSRRTAGILQVPPAPKRTRRGTIPRTSWGTRIPWKTNPWNPATWWNAKFRRTNRAIPTRSLLALWNRQRIHRPQKLYI